MTVSAPNTVGKPTNTVGELPPHIAFGLEVRDQIYSLANAGLGWEDIVVRLSSLRIPFDPWSVRQIVLKHNVKARRPLRQGL